MPALKESKQTAQLSFGTKRRFPAELRLFEHQVEGFTFWWGVATITGPHDDIGCEPFGPVAVYLSDGRTGRARLVDQKSEGDAITLAVIGATPLTDKPDPKRTVADEIIEARGGWTDCGLSSLHSPSLPELAAEFDLKTDEGIYREIDAAEARRVARFVLQHELAYGSHRMPAEKAAELADRFLAQFGSGGTRYYTNGKLHESGGWNPATEFTFDAGILVIGEAASGCLWVEDED
jgi:hypothetical protein